MKRFDWDQEKNHKLKASRGIGFEDIKEGIDTDHLVDIVPHPNQAKYPAQRVFIVDIESYIYLVPFVESKDQYFLKTIFASRKMTKKYLSERKEK